MKRFVKIFPIHAQEYFCIYLANVPGPIIFKGHALHAIITTLCRYVNISWLWWDQVGIITLIYIIM